MLYEPDFQQLQTELEKTESPKNDLRTVTEIQQRIKGLELELLRLSLEQRKDGHSSQVAFLIFELENLNDILLVYRHFSFTESLIIRFFKSQLKRALKEVRVNEERGYNLKLNNQLRYIKLLNYLLAPCVVRECEDAIKIEYIGNKQLQLV